MKNAVNNNRKINISLTISKLNLDEIKRISIDSKKSVSNLIEQTIVEYLERQTVRELVHSYHSHPVKKEEWKDSRDWSEFDIDKGLS